MKQPNNSGVISVSLLPAIGYIHGECNKISLKGCYFLRVLHSTLYHLMKNKYENIKNGGYKVNFKSTILKKWGFYKGGGVFGVISTLFKICAIEFSPIHPILDKIIMGGWENYRLDWNALFLISIVKCPLNTALWSMNSSYQTT